MEKLNATLIIKNARQKLEGRDVRRMAVIHTGVTVAAGLVITLLQYALAAGIGNTSGLSGLGTSAVLETAQTVLQWANMLLLPFWNLGFLYAAMEWARGRAPQTKDLLTGFHRAGPVLGLLLNRMMLTIAVMVLCVNVGSVIYMMTPAAAAITDLSAEAGGDLGVLYQLMEQLTEAEITGLMQAMIPLVVIWCVLSLVLLVPLLYRFRLAEYVILDQRSMRALPAMIVSAKLMRRRCWQMFQIDLRFWWYYGLKVLCTVLCYGDILLSLMGVSLPLGSDAMYFVTYLLYLLALFCVEVCFRPRVETAYAAAYEALKEMDPVQKKPVQTPEKMPWDEQ